MNAVGRWDTRRARIVNADPPDEVDPALTPVREGTPNPMGKGSSRFDKPNQGLHNRWGSLSTFWITAGVLLAVLLVLVPIVNDGSIAWPDDGVYAAQVDNLTHGSWTSARPLADLDADGANSAISPSFTAGDLQVPYDRHPLFVVALVPFYAAAGFVGMSLFSVLGTWGAAVAAGLLGRRLDSTYGVPALLLTGLASPLIFDAYLVSAHAATAAFVGFAALGASRVVDDRRWLPLLYTVPCAALAVALRSEGFIAVAALGVVIGAMAVTSSIRLRQIRWQPIIAATVVLVTAVAVYLADNMWRQQIERVSGGTGGPLTAVPDESERGLLSAVWTGLFRPWFASNLDAKPALALGAISIVLASVVLKVIPGRWLLPMALLGFGCSALVLQQFLEITLITGLFAAFPLLLAGLIQLRRSDVLDPLVMRGLATALLATALIAATTYADGGAVTWGGRFYHLLLPLVIPLAVLGLRRAGDVLPRRAGVIALVLVLLISASTSVFALRAQVQLRSTLGGVAEHTLDFAERHTTTQNPSDRPLIVVGLLYGDGTSRAFWDAGDRADVLAARGAPDIFRVIDRAKTAGYHSVTVVSNLTPPVLATVGISWLDRTGWEALETEQAGDTPFVMYQFGEPAGADDQPAE